MLIFSFFIDHTEKENLKSWSIFTVYSMTHRKNLYLGEEKKIHIWRERERRDYSDQITLRIYRRKKKEK